MGDGGGTDWLLVECSVGDILGSARFMAMDSRLLHMAEEGDETALEALKDRLPDVEGSVERAASQLQQFTAARQTTVESALNDVALNLEDGAEEVAELLDRAYRGEIRSKTDLAVNVLDVAEENRLSFTASGAAGAYFGSFAGPFGSILGAAGGVAAVYLYEVKDGRHVIAIPLEHDRVPDGVEPAPASEPPLRDSRDLQSLLDQAFEAGEAVDQADSLRRTIDFDDIEDRLTELEYVETEEEDMYDGYYVEHNDMIFVTFFAESIEDD